MKILRAVVIITLLSVLSLSAQAATNVFNVTSGNGIDYTINGQGDPALTLVRGFTYEFIIYNLAIHPFDIQTTGGVPLDESDGVTNNGATSGTITFAVPNDALDELKYICLNHSGMTGPLHIVDPPTITITDFVPDTDVFLASTGSDALNLNVQYSTNLVEGIWTDADITFNQYLNGTNSTFVTLPSGNPVFFRTLQGFF